MSYGNKNNRITSGELLATSERLASAVARRGSWMPAWVGLLNGVTEGGGHDWGVRTFRIKNRPLHHEIVSKSLLNRLLRDQQGVRLQESHSTT